MFLVCVPVLFSYFSCLLVYLCAFLIGFCFVFVCLFVRLCVNLLVGWLVCVRFVCFLTRGGAHVVVVPTCFVLCSFCVFLVFLFVCCLVSC